MKYFKTRKIKENFSNDSRLRKAIRFLIENIADETREALLSNLEGEVEQSSESGYQSFDRFANRYSAASKLLRDFNNASKAFSSSPAKTTNDQELKSKLNIGYWKKRFANVRDSKAVEDFRAFTNYLNSMVAVSTTKPIDKYADDTTLKFNLTNPRGLPFSVIFKFTHQSAIRTSEKMGGSALCTAESGNCSNFRHYSSNGPLVTLTAIPGESFEERVSQHGLDEKPEDVKPSSYNVQTNLNLKNAFYDEFDPKFASFGMTMWYDDSTFKNPKENILKIYGLTAQDIATLLLEDRSKKFLEHQKYLVNNEADHSLYAQENLEKNLGIKNFAKEWLKNWVQVISHDGGVIKTFPQLKIFNSLSGPARARAGYLMNIVDYLDSSSLRKLFSGVKFDTEIIFFLKPGTKVWNCDFNNCSFTNGGEKNAYLAYFIGCNLNGGTFDHKFTGEFRAKRGGSFNVNNIEIKPGATIRFLDAHIQNCKFKDLIFNRSNVDFGGGKISNSKFENCNLERFMFGLEEFEDDTMELSNVIFDNCELERANFFNCKMTNVKFVNCNLKNANFLMVDTNSFKIEGGNTSGMITNSGLYSSNNSITAEGFKTKNVILKNFSTKNKKENYDMRKIRMNESSLRKLVKQILKESNPFYSRDHVEASHQRSGIERGPSDDSYWTEEAIELAEARDVNGLREFFHDVIREKMDASRVDYIQDPVEQHEEIISILETLGTDLQDDKQSASYDAQQLISQYWGSVTDAYGSPIYI